MNETIFITILSSLLASTGFWAFISKKEENKLKIKVATTDMLIGLGHDRIMSLGLEYLARGSITRSEYENLYTYLYLPYLALEGNGSAKKIMEEVTKLPLSYSVLGTDKERKK